MNRGEKLVKLRVNKLTKIFGKHPNHALKLLEEKKSKDEILAETGMTVGVNQATFDIHAGEVFVIMGLSGSGKSTIIRMLNRLIEPTGGSIEIDGEDIVKMNKEQLREVRRKKISMVFQQFALFPHKTLLQNTEYGLEIQGVDKETRAKKAKESLELVGLGGYTDKYPDELSGGMKQRVGLARALTNDPDILLMDEAFSALDPLIRKDMQDELMDLQEKMQKTIVFITHDLNEALRLGDRIALMKDGSVVQVGTPEDILMDPANDYVERFVEDVDLSRVLTAEQIMTRPVSMNVEKGARVALEVMKSEGVSSIYITGKNRQILGFVTADDADKAVKEEKSIEDVIQKDVVTVQLDTLLTDLFDKTSYATMPPAVIDEENRLRGIVVKGAVMGALAGNNEMIHSTQTEVTSS
ncbi:MAG TPA: glycine betaine/L-proline ABC transporter ATP-binding protein [Candidatus Avamphibacillus intestinigallinarum]|nr:glycine betaine/L-proline ABC transporter ATP-binding protein [Candidatus Avamphibacillus intestinigallinarum]